MSSELLLRVIQTAAIVVDVVIELIQLRQIRVQREMQAGAELLRPLQSPEMAEAILLLHDLPDGLDGKALKARLGKQFGSVMALLALFESLGPLVARGHIPAAMYAEFYRGATVMCWKKVRGYVEDQRRSGWPNLFEWLQWLANRMEERASLSADIPAFERFKDWRDSRDYERLSGDRPRA
jgi:hypothetical protein